MILPQTNNIILYADDDPDDLELLKEAFSIHSKYIDLITFGNGLELLKYLKFQSSSSVSPCLIILDINMPLVSGKEVLITLRTTEHYKHTPIILFTTSSQKDDEAFAQKYGAGFITKPIDLKQMENIADHLIDHCSDNIKEMLRAVKTLR